MGINKENNTDNDKKKDDNNPVAEHSSATSEDDRYHHSESKQKPTQIQNANWDNLPLGGSEDSNHDPPTSEPNEPDWMNLPLVESEATMANSGNFGNSEVETIE